MTATPDTERTPIGAAALAALWWDAIVTGMTGDGHDDAQQHQPDPELMWAEMNNPQRTIVVTATEAMLGSLHALTGEPTEGQPDTALPTGGSVPPANLPADSAPINPTPPSEKATPDDAQDAQRT